MGVTLYSTKISSLWDCPVRDPAMAGVKSKITVFGSPVWDEIYFLPDNNIIESTILEINGRHNK